MLRQNSSFQECNSAGCIHGRGGTVRGVVSEPEAGTSKMFPMGYELSSRKSIANRQILRCECGAPTYLLGLDEYLFDNAIANLIASLDKVDGMRDADTRITSAISRHPP